MDKKRILPLIVSLLFFSGAAYSNKYKLSADFSKWAMNGNVGEFKKALANDESLRFAPSSTGNMRAIEQALLMNVSSKAASLELVQLLVENGADPSFVNEIEHPSSKDKIISSPIISAVQVLVNYERTLKIWDDNLKRIPEFTPEKTTSMKERIEIVEFLLEEGADPNVTVDLLKQSLNAPKKVSRLLVDYGADISDLKAQLKSDISTENKKIAFLKSL